MKMVAGTARSMGFTVKGGTAPAIINIRSEMARLTKNRKAALRKIRC